MKNLMQTAILLFTLIMVTPSGMSQNIVISTGFDDYVISTESDDYVNPPISGGTEPKWGGGTEPQNYYSSSVTVIKSGSSNPSTKGVYVPSKGSMATTPRPSDEPSFGAVPSEPPAASIGITKPYLYHGEAPSLEELQSLGGELQKEGDIRYYALYNNKWCVDPIAFWMEDQTNSLSYIDVPQYITYFEKYPDGEVVTKDWGYMQEGFHPAWFSADEKGWHRVAIWGSISGWSNVVWIYVY